MATTSTPTLGAPSATATAAPKIELGATLQAVFHGVLPAGVTSIDPSKASQYVQQLAQSNPSEFLVLQRMLMNSGALDKSDPLGNTPQSTTATATAFQQLLQSTQNGQGGLTAGGKSQNASQVLQDYGGSQGQTVTGGNGEGSGSNTPKPVDVTGTDVSVTPTNANSIETDVNSDLQSMSGIGLTPQQAQGAISEVQGSEEAHAQAEEDQDNDQKQQEYTQAVHQQQAQLQQNTNLIVKDQVPNPDIKNPGQYAQAVLGYLGVKNDPQAVKAFTAYLTSAGHWGDGTKNPLGLKLAVGNSSHDPKTFGATYTSWAQSIVASASILASDPQILQGLQGGNDQTAVVSLNNATGNRVSKNGFSTHAQVASGFVDHMTKQQQQKFQKMSATNQAPNQFTTNTPPGKGIEGLIPKNAGGTKGDTTLLGSATGWLNKQKGGGQQQQNSNAPSWGGATGAGPRTSNDRSAAPAPSQPAPTPTPSYGATGPGQPGSIMGGVKGFMGSTPTPTQGQQPAGQGENRGSGPPVMSGQDVTSGTPSNLGNLYQPGKVVALPPTVDAEDVANQIALGPDRQQTLGNDYLENYLKLMDFINTTASSMESRFGAGSHG